MKGFIVYNETTGHLKSCGFVDETATPDGTTTQERINEFLAANSGHACEYYDDLVLPDRALYKMDIGTIKIVEMTPEEVTDKNKLAMAYSSLKSRDIELFKMLLGVWQVGVNKGLWSGPDLSQELRAIAIEWKNQLDIIQGV